MTITTTTRATPTNSGTLPASKIHCPKPRPGGRKLKLVFVLIIFRRLILVLGKNGRMRRFSTLEDFQIFPAQRRPDQVLPKLAFYLCVTAEREFPCQRLAFDKPADRFRKRGRISHWKKQTGLTIHDQIDDAG